MRTKGNKVYEGVVNAVFIQKKWVVTVKKEIPVVSKSVLTGVINKIHLCKIW